MKKFFRGIMVPVMTPFTAKGEIDKDAFVKHVSFLIESGVNSLLVPSGTGEFANLTWEEKSMLTRLAAETSAGRIPVVALVSDCSTRNVISLANIAKDAGADEIMLTPPYYSYVDQRALLEMYTTVADTCNLPLWIYHQPGETKIVIGSPASINGSILNPKTEPVPKSSRINPSNVSEKVNPKPIPIPSKTDGITGFSEAKLSARANSIQLTTTKDRNSPNVSYISGRNFLIIICTKVEKVAMTKI